MYTIKKISKDTIQDMRDNYYNQLTAPMDDFWEEGIIPSCDFYTISLNQVIGYFALDEEGFLLQFYLVDSTAYNQVFKEIMTLHGIKRVYAPTYDPQLYNACKLISNSKEPNTFLYTQDLIHKPTSPIEEVTYRLAKKDEIKTAVEYNETKLNESGPWLEGYYTKLIKKNGLYFFFINDEIIGTGESRKSTSSKNVSNIGVTVSESHRKKGLATYIINTMRELNNKVGYHTICSTTVDNIGSQKTLSKCGFTLYHKIDTFKL